MAADQSRILDRKVTPISDWLRNKVDESLADPRSNVSADTVFKRLRAHRERTLLNSANE